MLSILTSLYATRRDFRKDSSIPLVLAIIVSVIVSSLILLYLIYRYRQRRKNIQTIRNIQEEEHRNVPIGYRISR
jgi:predicted permease